MKCSLLEFTSIYFTFNSIVFLTEPGCSGHSTLTGSPSYLTSHPGAGQWSVEAAAKCSWTIIAPVGQYVVLKANNIWLNCHGAWHTLGLYDGPTSTDTNGIAVVWI